MTESTPKQQTTKPRRGKVYPSVGRAVVTATFNNTLITVTDNEGNTIASSSCGRVGFKGTRKSTSYAASKAGEDAAKKALDKGVREVAVFIKGPGSGRVGAVKSLRSAGLRISSLTDITPLPHNGCRPKNRRKV